MKILFCLFFSMALFGMEEKGGGSAGEYRKHLLKLDIPNASSDQKRSRLGILSPSSSWQKPSPGKGISPTGKPSRLSPPLHDSPSMKFKLVKQASWSSMTTQEKEAHEQQEAKRQEALEEARGQAAATEQEDGD